MNAKVAWIARSPVKGLRLELLEHAQIGPAGVHGDRSFLIADADGRMISSVRIGALLEVRPRHDESAGTLTITLPGGEEVSEPVKLGEPEQVSFHDGSLLARPLRGPVSQALSEHAGAPLRVFAAPDGGSSVDRGRDGAVTIVSTASLELLAQIAGAPVDHRRFRMTLGIDGVAAHEEDGWVERHVRVGEVELRVHGHVGRCVLTTRDPDSGRIDLPVLRHLAAYRSGLDSTEPLPFGVYASVVRGGPLSVGAPVTAC